jgi:predicted negative regulator of RcsB-dependent stress response
MVDDYATDRDQEEALRNWWRENWRWIIGGVVLGVALLVGWRYYQSHREQQAHKAAEMYSKLEAAVKSDDTAKASELLNDLSAEFDSSAYAQEARLLLAKSHVDHGKFDDAVPLLRAVVDKSDDQEMAQIARLRLARVLLQQGKHDEALKLLDTKDAGEFAGAEREVRGDAYFAKGDMEAARAEYAAALAGDDAPIDRTLLELKLQEVGGVAPSEKTDAKADAPAAAAEE